MMRTVASSPHRLGSIRCGRWVGAMHDGQRVLWLHLCACEWTLDVSIYTKMPCAVHGGSRAASHRMRVRCSRAWAMCTEMGLTTRACLPAGRHRLSRSIEPQHGEQQPRSANDGEGVNSFIRNNVLHSAHMAYSLACVAFVTTHKHTDTRTHCTWHEYRRVSTVLVNVCTHNTLMSKSFEQMCSWRDNVIIYVRSCRIPAASAICWG